MFDLSFGELLLLAVVAMVFIGPKELPVVVKAVAKALAYLKAMTRELKGAMDDLARESGLKDAQDDIEREMRMITGDDGKKYPAYDLPDLGRGQGAPTPPENGLIAPVIRKEQITWGAAPLADGSRPALQGKESNVNEKPTTPPAP